MVHFFLWQKNRHITFLKNYSYWLLNFVVVIENFICYCCLVDNCTIIIDSNSDFQIEFIEFSFINFD